MSGAKRIFIGSRNGESLGEGQVGGMLMKSAAVTLALLGIPLAVHAQHTPAPGHWPQWRGPNRDGVSTETGLLRKWPVGGPKLLWKSSGIGEGMSPPSIAGGLIYVTGYREDEEFLSAMDGTGKIIWSRHLGPNPGEYKLMRYLSQRFII